LKYNNRRAEYVSAWWHVVDWHVVDGRYRRAMQQLSGGAAREEL